MSFQPNPAFPASSPHAPQAPKGLAVTSLVLGILAILGCLVPVLNIGSIFLAVVSIVLGFVALRAVRRGRAGGKGLAVAGLVLAALAIVGAILANAVFGSVVNSVNDSLEADKAADAQAATQFPGATADDIVAQVGGAVTVDEVSITATAVAPQSGVMGEYLCATVTYVNNGDDQASFNTLDWQLQDPAGVARTFGIFGDNSLQAGQLAPTGTVSGDVCFEGTPDPGQYVLLYSGSLFGSERGAWLNTL